MITMPVIPATERDKHVRLNCPCGMIIKHSGTIQGVRACPDTARVILLHMPTMLEAGVMRKRSEISIDPLHMHSVLEV